MSYNTKNYTAQGGSVTVIGGELLINGKLTIAPGAEVSGLLDGVATLGNAELATLLPAPFVPDSKATTTAQLRSDFNLLLAKLRQAGVLTDAEPPDAGDPPDSAGDPPVLDGSGSDSL